MLGRHYEQRKYEQTCDQPTYNGMKNIDTVLILLQYVRKTCVLYTLYHFYQSILRARRDIFFDDLMVIWLCLMSGKSIKRRSHDALEPYQYYLAWSIEETLL